MLHKDYYLQIAAAVLYFLFFAHVGEAKVWINPMTCFHFEHHGLNKMYFLRKTICSYKTHHCRLWQGKKPVPSFDGNTEVPYYKADCGQCSKSEQDCKECTSNYCNYKEAWPGPYGSVTHDLMDQLLPLSSNKISWFDPRVKRQTGRNGKKGKTGKTASDFVSSNSDNNSGQRLMPVAGKPILSLTASIVTLVLTC